MLWLLSPWTIALLGFKAVGSQGQENPREARQSSLNSKTGFTMALPGCLPANLLLPTQTRRPKRRRKDVEEPLTSEWAHEFLG